MNLNGRDTRENAYTEVTRDAAIILQEVIDEIAADMGVPYGEQRVSTKMIRQRIREAADGDVEAMTEVANLAHQNGHTQDGDGCPVCQQVAAVLGESK